MKINFHSLYPLTLLIALGAAECPCPALGQGEVINDQIGLFADGGLQCADAALLDHLTLYAIMFCPSYPYIRGLELGLEVEGLVNTSLTPSFPVPAIWEGWPPADPGSFNLVVGYSDPLPAADFVHLVYLDVFFLDFQPLHFRMTSIFPAVPGNDRPAYLADPGSLLIPLTPLHYDGEDWDLAINDPNCSEITFPEQAFTCGPLPATTTSWGAVKSLYR